MTLSEETGNLTLDSEQIRRVLPHRFPFLLVDRILEMEPGRAAVGLKNVTVNEPFFQGHWPHRAVMPAVMILEAMAQVGGIMLLANEDQSGRNAYFTGINKARFRKTVVPGDALMIRVEIGRVRTKFGTVMAEATVNGQVVAEGELMFALTEEGVEDGS
jgi:3-hydroxyacyl-[acyl-carrier-protein] dehydratase